MDKSTQIEYYSWDDVRRRLGATGNEGAITHTDPETHSSYLVSLGTLKCSGNYTVWGAAYA